MIKIKRGRPSNEARELLRLFNGKGESEAYLKAKANNCAYIIEDGWIVRVYADDHREKIKYIGETQVEIKEKPINIE